MKERWRSWPRGADAISRNEARGWLPWPCLGSPRQINEWLATDVNVIPPWIDMRGKLVRCFPCPNSDISWCAQHVLITHGPSAKVYIGIKGITIIGRQHWSRMEIPSYIWSRGLFLIRSFSRLTWRYPLRPNMLYRILIARNTWPGSRIFWMLSATYSLNCYCEL